MTPKERITATVLAYVLWLAAFPSHAWLGGGRAPVAWMGLLGTLLVACTAVWVAVHRLPAGSGRARSLAWGVGFGSCAYVYPLLAYVILWMGVPETMESSQDMGPYMARMRRDVLVAAVVGTLVPVTTGVLAGVFGGLRRARSRPSVARPPRQTMGATAGLWVLFASFTIVQVWSSMLSFARNYADPYMLENMGNEVAQMSVSAVLVALGPALVVGWSVYELMVALVGWGVGRGATKEYALSAAFWGVMAWSLGSCLGVWWLIVQRGEDQEHLWQELPFFLAILLLLLGTASWKARETVRIEDTFVPASAVEQAAVGVGTQVVYFAPVVGYSIAFAALTSLTDTLEGGVRDPILATQAGSQMMWEHTMPIAIGMGQLFLWGLPSAAVLHLALAWASNRWLSNTPPPQGGRA